MWQIQDLYHSIGNSDNDNARDFAEYDTISATLPCKIVAPSKKGPSLDGIPERNTLFQYNLTITFSIFISEKRVLVCLHHGRKTGGQLVRQKTILNLFVL